MNKIFQYTKTEGQGWLVEKPEMPIHHVPETHNEFHELMGKVKEHATTLRRFKYDYPDPGKEMELLKDFEVNYRYVFQNEKSEPYAMPIYKDEENVTQRTYSEQEAEKLRNKIAAFIETSGYKLLPSAQTEILAMIHEAFGIEIK